MFNFGHYTNMFGYSTTQPFTILFPCQFFIYNYRKVLVPQALSKPLPFAFIKGTCAKMFVCD